MTRYFFPLGRVRISVHAGIAYVEDVVIGVYCFVPILYQCLIHILYVLEVTVAELDDVRMAEMGD